LGPAKTTLLSWLGAGIVQTARQLVRGWKARGARFSAPVNSCTGTHTASCTKGKGSLSRR